MAQSSWFHSSFQSVSSLGGPDLALTVDPQDENLTLACSRMQSSFKWSSLALTHWSKLSVRRWWMLVQMDLERALTGWYQDAWSVPSRCCPAGERHPSPGPPNCRSRSGTCGMARTAGGVDCPDFGCGDLDQGCTTRTSRQHRSHSLLAL